MKHDPVNSPSHYTQGGIETIDYMRAKLSPEEFKGYCRGNVIKYISRAPDKNGLEDLKKARQYLDWLIKHAEENLEPEANEDEDLRKGICDDCEGYYTLYDCGPNMICFKCLESREDGDV